MHWNRCGSADKSADTAPRHIEYKLEEVSSALQVAINIRKALFNLIKKSTCYQIQLGHNASSNYSLLLFLQVIAPFPLLFTANCPISKKEKKAQNRSVFPLFYTSAQNTLTFWEVRHRKSHFLYKSRGRLCKKSICLVGGLMRIINMKESLPTQ